MALPGKIVISQPWGGLGENLMYSTLPERFAAVGIPSYISRKNALRMTLAIIAQSWRDMNPS